MGLLKNDIYNALSMHAGGYSCESHYVTQLAPTMFGNSGGSRDELALVESVHKNGWLEGGGGAHTVGRIISKS